MCLSCLCRFFKLSALGRLEYFENESATKVLGGVQLSASAKFSRTIVQGKHALEIIGNVRVLQSGADHLVAHADAPADIGDWREKLEAAACECGGARVRAGG